MITELEFRRAYDNLKKFVKQTPLIYSDWLSKELNGSVYLKLECFNPRNSFKIRGAVNSILEEEKLPEKIITASGGNHGLGVVIACNLFNLQCTVVLPKSTSQFRVDLLKNLGADGSLGMHGMKQMNMRLHLWKKECQNIYMHLQISQL